MEKKPALQFIRTINAPPAEVFRALTHATALRDWLSVSAHTQARLNGYFLFQWPDQSIVQGIYTRFEPGKALAFSWQPLGDASIDSIEVLLEPVDEGTRLTLTHSICEDCDQARQMYTLSWLDALDNLQSMLETGIDLRLVRRPRMGIFMDEFTAGVADRLGAPVQAGILISGTAQGSGAEKAGLVKNDILVVMDGQPTDTPSALGPILQGHRAGDRLGIEFYRGPEKITTEIELSAFPIPVFPETAAEFAQAARQGYAAVLAGIRELTQGLSNAVVSQRPAANEWSVKELIAHFILCERDYQSWAADMLNDLPVNDSLEYRPNVNLRLAALLNRFESADGLLQELEAAYAESADLLENLPEHFVKWRKHLYRRLAAWALIYVPEHLDDEHREQFIRTIDLAKTNA